MATNRGLLLTLYKLLLAINAIEILVETWKRYRRMPAHDAPSTISVSCLMEQRRFDCVQYN